MLLEVEKQRADFETSQIEIALKQKKEDAERLEMMEHERAKMSAEKLQLEQQLKEAFQKELDRLQNEHSSRLLEKTLGTEIIFH